MFFDAQRRFATGEFSYKRSLLAQYGNNGTPFKVTKAPKSAFDAQAALEFRRQERAEFERLKQKYSELEDKSERLAQIFLDSKRRNASSSRKRDNRDVGRDTLLLPTSRASDNDNATRT